MNSQGQTVCYGDIIDFNCGSNEVYYFTMYFIIDWIKFDTVLIIGHS